MVSSNQFVDMKATSFISYKAAIALNNIGVTLLARCRYNDALVSKWVYVDEFIIKRKHIEEIFRFGLL